MRDNVLLFTVGPLMQYNETLDIKGLQLPYFRTDEFSEINLTIEKRLKKSVLAPELSSVVLLTTSGTGGMEASVVNTFNKNDKVLIINGGSFGMRFTEICKIHTIPYHEIILKPGKRLTKEDINKHKGQGYTGVLVNAHETSTGVLYDLDMLGRFCKEESCLFCVDAISSYLADDLNMNKMNIDILIISSQKALALDPGLTILILSDGAKTKIDKIDPKCLYLNIKVHLKNMERGQTPYTPAVGIILQLHKRLEGIDKLGLKSIIAQTGNIAQDFRNKCKKLPVTFFAENPSNALTSLEVKQPFDANEIFHFLKEKYNIYVTPNGGALSETVFRVGHLGNISVRDNDLLINGLKKYFEGVNK